MQSILNSLNSLLEQYIPNVMVKPEELGKAISETLRMVGFSAIIAFTIGIVIGILLETTKPGKVLENSWIQWVLDKIINVFRSIPFVILITLLLPLTRAIVGSGIGVKGAIIPLVFGTVPFFSRQVEMALAEVDSGLVEAAEAMGSAPWEIVFHVYLREAVPGLIRGTTLTLVSLIGLTAMAGAIGAGGLGDFAIRYGHSHRQFDVTLVVVAIILLMVTLIQTIGNALSRYYSHDAG